MRSRVIQRRSEVTKKQHGSTNVDDEATSRAAVCARGAALTMGGGRPTAAGAALGGLAGASAVAIATVGAAATATGLVVGTARTVLSLIADFGVNSLGLGAISASDALPPAGPDTSPQSTSPSQCE